MEDEKHSQSASISQNWMASQAAKRKNKCRGYLPIFHSTEKSNSVKNDYLRSNTDVNSNFNINQFQNISNKNKPLFEEEEKHAEENTESLWRPQSAVAWTDPNETYSGEMNEEENISNVASGPSEPKLSDKPSLFRLDSFKKSRRRNGRKRKLSILLGMNMSSPTTNTSAHTAGQGPEVGPGSSPGSGGSSAPTTCSQSVPNPQYLPARVGSQRRRSDGETYACTVRGNLDRVWSFHGSEFGSEEENGPNSLGGAGRGAPNGPHTSPNDFPTATMTRQNSASGRGSHGSSKPTSSIHASTDGCASSSRDRWYDWPIRVLRNGQGQGRSPPMTTHSPSVVYEDSSGTNTKNISTEGRSFACPQGEDRLFATRASKEQSLERARSSQLSQARSRSKLVAYDLSSDEEFDNVKPLEKVVMKPVARRK